MCRFLIDLLQDLETLVPPPQNCHHAITFARFGGDAEGWTDKLALQVNQGSVFRCLFLDEDDFAKSPHSLAREIAGMLRGPPWPREQLGVGLGQYLFY